MPRYFTAIKSGQHLNASIIAIEATPDGGGHVEHSEREGYTLVAADSGVSSYGDAPCYGSRGATPPTSPVVDLSPPSADNGSYLVTSAGAKHGAVVSILVPLRLVSSTVASVALQCTDSSTPAKGEPAELRIIRVESGTSPLTELLLVVSSPANPAEPRYVLDAFVKRLEAAISGVAR